MSMRKQRCAEAIFSLPPPPRRHLPADAARAGTPALQRGTRSGIAAGLMLVAVTSCVPDVEAEYGVKIPAGVEEIDFADDNDGSLALSHGRKGGWGTYHDNCPGGTMDPSNGPLLPKSGGVNGTRGYYGVTATGFHPLHLDAADTNGQCWGAFVYFDLNNDGQTTTRDYDASPYTGIYFTARGTTNQNNQVNVRLVQADLVPKSIGGYCDPSEHPTEVQNGCEDHYGAIITIGPDWAGYELRFDDLQQRNFGLKLKFNPKMLRSVQFIGNSGDEGIAFDLNIDQVGFLTD